MSCKNCKGFSGSVIHERRWRSIEGNFIDFMSAMYEGNGADENRISVKAKWGDDGLYMNVLMSSVSVELRVNVILTYS